MRYVVDPDVRRASTLPAAFYADPVAWQNGVDRIFARTWQPVAAVQDMEEYTVRPVTLLPGVLDEPLMVVRDGAAWRCLSNVCTHRANLVAEAPGCPDRLRCRYHGRIFGLDGRMHAMPGFGDAEDFPRPQDDLPERPLERFARFAFTSLEPAAPFAEFVAPMLERLGWFPFDELQATPGDDRDYRVRAHWALYCDNYLEGFHIPFVHRGLNKLIDFDTYTTETFAYAVLQLGMARPGQAAFDPPAGSPEHGKRVAAYYWWIFPNLMFNVYPWGVSVNFVDPVSPSETVVRFRNLLLPGASPDDRHDLHTVELEDEEVVEGVQCGLRSRLYRSGRFAPGLEDGVHRFHRLLAEFVG